MDKEVKITKRRRSTSPTKEDILQAELKEQFLSELELINDYLTNYTKNERTCVYDDLFYVQPILVNLFSEKEELYTNQYGFCVIHKNKMKETVLLYNNFIKYAVRKNLPSVWDISDAPEVLKKLQPVFNLKEVKARIKKITK